MGRVRNMNRIRLKKLRMHIKIHEMKFGFHGVVTD